MSDDADLDKIPGALVTEQSSDMSLREFVECEMRSPSLRMRREDLFAVPELKPEDLFLTVDPAAFSKLDDETMRRMVELVRPIVAERSGRKMSAQRIEELTETTKTMRASKQFTSEYFDMLQELSALKQTTAPIAVNTNRFTGSYAGACAFFAGRPFAKVPFTGKLHGGPAQWAAR